MTPLPLPTPIRLIQQPRPRVRHRLVNPALSARIFRHIRSRRRVIVLVIIITIRKGGGMDASTVDTDTGPSIRSARATTRHRGALLRRPVGLPQAGGVLGRVGGGGALAGLGGGGAGGGFGGGHGCFRSTGVADSRLSEVSACKKRSGRGLLLVIGPPTLIETPQGPGQGCGFNAPGGVALPSYDKAGDMVAVSLLSRSESSSGGGAGTEGCGIYSVDTIVA